MYPHTHTHTDTRPRSLFINSVYFVFLLLCLRGLDVVPVGGAGGDGGGAGENLNGFLHLT